MDERYDSSETIRSVFDELSPSYDTWLSSLEGSVYGHVTWENLKAHLPPQRGASILDAGGGTGRWTVPLAKMGYRVTLCDISPGMLAQAAGKIRMEGLSDRVTVDEQDLTRLPYASETFDFVLCEDGPISISDSVKVTHELARVLKPKGRVWAAVLGRYPLALTELGQDPARALKLCTSELNLTFYKGTENARLFTPEELERLFEERGLKVIKIYGNRIAINAIPRETQQLAHYDDTLFSNLASMELYLSKIPAALGMAEYLQIVGEKK